MDEATPQELATYGDTREWIKQNFFDYGGTLGEPYGPGYGCYFIGNDGDNVNWGLQLLLTKKEPELGPNRKSPIWHNAEIQEEKLFLPDNNEWAHIKFLRRVGFEDHYLDDSDDENDDD